jgi:hypothetical protein
MGETKKIKFARGVILTNFFAGVKQKSPTLQEVKTYLPFFLSSSTNDASVLHYKSDKNILKL